MKNLRFKNKDLLETALTHKSKSNEAKGMGENNERLEFLGDAVLQFIVSKELYAKFPKKQEGYLTLLRANIVGNELNLAEMSKKLELGRELNLGKGEELEGGREKPTILANALEALIGAIYLDQGIEAAEEFIKRQILSALPQKLEESLKHPKSVLQELLQAEGLEAPDYEISGEGGPDHQKLFEVEAKLGGKTIGKGKGPSKSKAEEDAARGALEYLAKKGKINP